MGRGKKIVDVERVVEEAVALIEEGGVGEFSTRRLAARLGISAMTLYNYYENRGAIVKEALRRSLGLLWDGLAPKIAARRGGGGSVLGAYRVLADHLLAFALARPRLCRFILTEVDGAGWISSDGRIEEVLGPDGEREDARTDEIRRDIYLFDLLAIALALKVIEGGETPERFAQLIAEGFERLLAHHEKAIS